MSPSPKNVVIKVSINEYVKMAKIAELFNVMKDDKEFRSIFDIFVQKYSDDFNFNSISAFLEKLPEREISSKRITSNQNANKPTTSIFIEEVPSNESVKHLYNKVKNSIPNDKLRFDQTKSTCHSDVKIMFYKYIEIKNLKTETHIVIDDFLRKIAPKYLSNEIVEVKRNDLKTIWNVCSNIRN